MVVKGSSDGDCYANLRPPAFQYNGHLQTIFPSMVRRVSGVTYDRERITTPDNDFLDLDWVLNGGSKLLVISHGLEGDSYRSYVRGMAKKFNKVDWDTLAWNYRGCSGEINRQLRFYHSGATDDLHRVIQHAWSTKRYNNIHLLGFSLGGNLTLKYLGEIGKQLYYIAKGLVFSTPLDLQASSLRLADGFNKIYSQRFLRSLKNKVVLKSKLYPNKFNLQQLERINSLLDFDEHFTAPMHGFDGAVDYYSQCSSGRFITDIQVPTAIVNAQNDPFLPASSYQLPESASNLVKIITPRVGGHVGFKHTWSPGIYWSESFAWKYLNQ